MVAITMVFWRNALPLLAALLVLQCSHFAIAQHAVQGSGADVWRARCFASVAKQSYQTALQECGAAIDADPNNPEPYSNRGSAYLFLNRAEMAIKDFTTAIRLDPSDARHYYNRALALEAMSRPLSAKEDYDTAIRLRPDMAAAYYNRAQLLSAAGQLTAAASDYRKAMELDAQFKGLVKAALARLGSDL